jgi:hypothetical protein
MKFVTEKFLSTEQLEDFSVCRRGTDGSEAWTDQDGKPHREDGPAYTSPDGAIKHWYKHGLHHREDGPAFSDSFFEGWMLNGRYHRDDGFAFVDKRNSSCSVYMLNGKTVPKNQILALGKMK